MGVNPFLTGDCIWRIDIDSLSYSRPGIFVGGRGGDRPLTHWIEAFARMVDTVVSQAIVYSRDVIPGAAHGDKPHLLYNKHVDGRQGRRHARSWQVLCLATEKLGHGAGSCL